jgi:hypothetical protein
MIPQPKFFFADFNEWVSKNAEFVADFKSVEKIAKMPLKKVTGRKLLHTVIIAKNSIFSFFVDKFFFHELFCKFSADSAYVEIKSIFCKKLFLGSY